MAKTYIDVVKYMVETRFEVDGMVEKPDIIGAVFGQTEGLLGGDLDLRELQKNGKIGRIEIDTGATSGRTSGRLYLPSSLGRVDTCILAAAIESVDRVGPFETHFKIDKIEDTRSERRKRIVDRAKELLKTLLTTEIPDSKEISELVESDVKSSIITTYGPEQLPAGPEIASSNEIILVEGRADVVNLLRNDMENCIAVGGATGTIPKTIIELSRSKETTLFVDGDRGGDIIAKNLLAVADIDFVAKAPSGKEVEELTRKDIIKALRSRIPVEQFNSHSRQTESNGNNGNDRQQQRSRPQQRQQSRQQRYEAQPAQRQSHQEPRQDPMLSPTALSDRMLNRNGQQSPGSRSSDSGIADIRDSSDAQSGVDIPSIEDVPQPAQAEASKQYVDALAELHNTLRGRLYDSQGGMITEIPVRDLLQSIQDASNASVIVFDGVITQRLLELASSRGVKAVYANRQGQVFKMPPGIAVYTSEK